MKTGDIFQANQGGSCVVVQYIDYKNVVIEFQDQYRYTATVSADSLLRGRFKNPYHPNVFGVGYIGIGSAIVSTNRKASIEYRTWASMLKRCYNEDYLSKYPTYRGCTVCDEWHNFQVFSKWLLGNRYHGLGYELDKDLLAVNSKVYSPNTCVLIPQQINKILTSSGAARGKYPLGVSRNKRRGVFQAHLRMNSQPTNLGSFDCPKDAHEAYVIAKEAYVKETALEWKDRIDPRAFSALMNWRVQSLDQ